MIRKHVTTTFVLAGDYWNKGISFLS